MIKAASLMDVRRKWPGIRFDSKWPGIRFDISQRLTAGYGADGARLEAPYGRITAFWPASGFERPGRSGRFGRGE